MSRYTMIVYKEYIVRKYEANGGTEYFISLESQDRKCIFGFTRLRIPYDNNNIEFECLRNTALIRELHVYGNLIPVGFQKNKDSQHKGVGKTLIEEAELIALENGYDRIAVISGIGVMDYYKKLGYKYEDTFMIKELNNEVWFMDEMFILLVFVMFLFVFIVLSYS